MNTGKRVLAIGWYGAGNVGDELLLSLLVRWAREAGATVVAASIDPAATRARHGVEAVDAWNLPELVRALRDCDLCVLGGGGLLHTHFPLDLPSLYRGAQGDIAGYVRPLLAARQLGVPVLAWAQGVGPLDDADARAIVRDVFTHALAVGVRDDESRELLAQIGVARDVLVAPDPVWALDALAAPVVRDRIAVVVRPWADAHWEDRCVEALAATVDPVRHALAWIPFQPEAVAGRSQSDLALVHRLMARMPEGLRQDCIVDADPARVTDALAACERVVAMRLHAQILGLRRGAPVLAIEYDDKMAATSRLAHAPDALRLAPSADAAAWRAAMQALLATQWRLPRDEADALAARAHAHRTQLQAAIARAQRHDAPSLAATDWLSTWRDESARAIEQADAKAMFWQRAHDAEQAVHVADNARWQVWMDGADASIALAEAGRDAALAEVDRVRAEVDRVRADADRARADADRARDAHAQATAALAQAEAALAREQHAFQAAREAFAERAGDDARTRAALEQALLESQGRAARAEYQRDHVHGLLGERERELAVVLGSRSWRITRPLRGLNALFSTDGRRRVLQRLRRETPSTAEGVPHAAHDAAPMAASASAPGWVGIANAASRLAIVPCAFEFDELANQRPINLAKYLAAQGWTVLFAAWQWYRDEALARSNTEVHPGVWQVDLYALLDHAAALAPRAAGEALYFITLPAPDLVGLHGGLRARGFGIVYDILDDWEAFSGVGQAPWFDAASERLAVLASDAVAAVSPPLAAKFADLRTDIAVIGNGWAPATLGAERRDCAAAARVPGAPLRIGYFGHLTDAWFDWRLVLDAVSAMPDATFEIIGYGEPDWVREAARELPNLVLVGKVSPSRLWEHAQGWQVALAPFRPGPLAIAIDPIKVYEYLFLGVPTVCTGIPHLAQLPAVRVVQGLDAFVDACRAQAIAPMDLAAIDATLARTTWAARFDAMLSRVPRDGGLGALYAA